MIRKIIIITIIVCFSFTLSFSEESVDLDKFTQDCLSAAKEYRAIKKNYPYKMLHTVQYRGWSGDSNKFELTYPVVMTIRYAGTTKEGYYWFEKYPQKKYQFTAKSDITGNYEMAVKSGDGFNNGSFRGIMKDGVIKGLWEKGSGKKGFAFYVKAIK